MDTTKRISKDKYERPKKTIQDNRPCLQSVIYLHHGCNRCKKELRSSPT